ncbi:O-glucosyltransferase rumi homolog [Neodiprion fabricii]|uniref:O-glucosyltransferase rumi homolog n=1 Tax=Neodiprion fabricii TaxID=2872261 RepID=UPI001ED94A7F|nr:O-glucosyltransferase rumi homolog [Neodiprion fabricii]
MHFMYCLVFSVLLTKIGQAEEFCAANSKDDCEARNESLDKYSKESNRRYEKYLNAIRNAENQTASGDEFSHRSCACYKNVIKHDLKVFKKTGISEESITLAKSRGTFYQIINGRLYREKDCMFPSRCAGIEHFILSIIWDLPDMELVINTRDYPQSSKYFGEPLPVFSFSKTPDYFDITYPAWSFWEGGPAISLYPRGLGRWDLHRISLDRASEKKPWHDKQDKAFFRGSRTSSERDNLVLLSRRQPDLVDARYTKNQAWKSEADTLHMPPAQETPLESHCDFKYLFNFRGVAASFRHKHLFLCRSLVFHVGEEWTEFYYTAMKPWHHYIPVPTDASQETLQELILFAKENDDIAHKIADQGRNFVWNHLRMEDVTCFWKSLLKRYVKLLTYKPVLDKRLIEIEQK